MLLHRGMLFVRYGGDLNALFLANPNWITVQLQARDALEVSPLASLWYLQQAPPVPNAVMAGVLQVASWPTGVGWCLVALQVLCSLAVALLLIAVSSRLVPRWIALGLGLLWVLSPDVVVLETTGIGQIFYENLAALGVLACVYGFLRWCETPDGHLERRWGFRWALGLGVAAGLLALTRSSYGFLSLPLLVLMLVRVVLLDVETRRAALRQVAACAVVALSIQGAWAVKNLLIFGHWTWPASTWGGASLAASIHSVGAGDELVDSILSEPERSASWFVGFVEVHGSRPWTFDWQGAEFCPQELRRQDARITDRLGQNRPDNGQCLRRVSEEFGDASIRFLLRNPGVLLEKIKLGYATYWFPIRYHGGQYLSLFATDWRVERSLRPWRVVSQVFSGELPEPAYVYAGTWPDTTRRPARLFTLDLPITLWWLMEILVLHLVVPVAVLTILWRVYRTRSLTSRDALMLMLAMTYAYSAGLHNLAEFGENMRFRWNVEPVIWLLVIDSIARLTSKVRQVRSRGPETRSADRARSASQPEGRA